jgi:nitrate/nitrite-specific signal transduction histidine kinase
MRERALLVGGALEIDSRPGKGTTVRLEVPAGAPADRDGDVAPLRTEAA